MRLHRVTGRPGRVAAVAIGLLYLGWGDLSAGAAALYPPHAWPDPAAVAAVTGESVTFPSHSPFTLADAGAGPERNPETTARGILFLPKGASADAPAPAVVMLHGAAGVVGARGPTYGRQLAAMGVAALVIDAFGARRDRAERFVDRIIRITETMLLADAYAALAYLAARPEVDGGRVALIGFSYGGMASIYAAYAQVAERMAPGGARFAGHVTFYAPCLARFEDNRTTGAPVLMLSGAEDATVDQARCAEIAADLRAGGARVETIVYADAYHQWDGRFAGPRTRSRNIAGCRFEVKQNGQVRDSFTRLPMTGPLTRRLILAACIANESYLIGRDDAVRARSNRDLGRFLTRVFGE